MLYNGVMNFEVIQEVILTLTPVVAIIIALAGLNTWRRSLKGSYDFELSRRLLLSIYKSRDALRAARNSFLQIGEAEKHRSDWEASAYERRWATVVEAMTELRAAILESEVSWGEDFKKETKGLHVLMVRLSMSIRHYLASMDKSPGSRLFNDNDEKVLWGDDDDEYDLELSEVIRKFEQKIKPKIGRK